MTRGCLEQALSTEDLQMMWHYARGGSQLGPVSWEDLVNAARTGNLGPGDLVWTEGMAQWQTAASIPGLIPQTAPPPPPAYGAPPPAYGAPPVSQGYGAPPVQPGYAPAYPAVRQPSVGDDPAMRMLLPVGRSGWAIAAGYLGLFSVLGIFAPPAVICGLLAIRDIRQHPEKHGLGRAWFGIVMGILGSTALVVLIIMAAMSTSR
jgi:uncharacterized protein DUF4339/uncharacterized protein DUF4190